LPSIVEALNGTEEIRQRVFGVSADEGEEDPGSEKRGLGAPALLRKISPGWTAAGQEQEEHNDGEIKTLKSRWVVVMAPDETPFKSCLFTYRGHHRKS
uniref:Uncharacterized protein n=1 Tax=Lates calcarifer TaxID=8187 RepID=A0A4W6FQY6_LATCA